MMQIRQQDEWGQYLMELFNGLEEIIFLSFSFLSGVKCGQQMVSGLLPPLWLHITEVFSAFSSFPRCVWLVQRPQCGGVTWGGRGSVSPPTNPSRLWAHWASLRGHRPSTNVVLLTAKLNRRPPGSESAVRDVSRRADALRGKLDARL